MKAPLRSELTGISTPPWNDSPAPVWACPLAYGWPPRLLSPDYGDQGEYAGPCRVIKPVIDLRSGWRSYQPSPVLSRTCPKASVLWRGSTFHFESWGLFERAFTSASGLGLGGRHKS